MLRHVETKSKGTPRKHWAEHNVTETATPRTHNIGWYAPNREWGTDHAGKCQQGSPNRQTQRGQAQKEGCLTVGTPHTTTPAPETGKSPHGGGDTHATRGAHTGEEDRRHPDTSHTPKPVITRHVPVACFRNPSAPFRFCPFYPQRVPELDSLV